MNTRLIPSRSYPDNIVSHLQRLARERPADPALIVVSAAGDELVDKQFDYASLDLHVRAVAAVLQDRFMRGERALLLMDNDEHYVIGFLACLYAGMIAVPAFPPESIREQHLARLLAIAADAKARCIVTASQFLPLINDAAIAQLAGADILTVDTLTQNKVPAWHARLPEKDEIAFLQYTSGSTSTPKGVMVSHHNLMINARVFEEGMSIDSDDIFVSWLPLYHDMGLIGGLLQPLHRGVPVVLMTPSFFVERPVRWLEVISRYRATVSGAPNFAFQLCVERVRNAQLQELDLSSWRVAFSGAEPVRRDTMWAFIERFSSVGFSAGTIYPCYGLAEATLFVTGGVRGEGMKAHDFSTEKLAQGKAEVAASGTSLVACGFPASHHSIAIVDPEKLIPLADGNVGEIWTDGASLACGYWQRPQETAETFVTYEGKRWLRTGDLGFIYAGQLYIVGRRKDLIIIRGQNIYPQDIELVIEEEVEAVRKGRIAAFSVETRDGEGIGIAVEVSRNMQKLVSAETLVNVLNETVSISCQEPLSVVVLLNPGALPKTSSGKLQRAACRQGWRERTLDAYAIYEFGGFVIGGSTQPPQALTDETEMVLAAIWQSVLNHTELGREDHFFAMGGNSLATAQVAARISDHWQINFSPRSLFQHPRLHACAAEIKHLLSAGCSPLAADSRIVPVQHGVNSIPLSYGQQRLWFLWQLDPANTAYHIQYALRLAGLLDVQALHASFHGLIERHESLRTIFCIGADGSAEQVIQPLPQFAMTQIDLGEVAASERTARAAAEAQRMVSIPFDLTQGPLLRVARVRMTENESILIIVMHHIISDGASMQIMIDELAARYQAHLRGETASLNNLPIQYADYTLWQQKWLQAGEKERQLAYWQDYLGSEHPILTLPTDRPRQPLTSYQAARHRFDLPTAVLSKLRKLIQDRGTTLFMALSTAFQALLFRHTGQHDIRVGVPIANRNRVETAGLIGFFVNTQVLRGQLHGRMTLAELLEQVREAAIEAQAHQDLPFEQLVEALHPQRDVRHSPLFQVTINHLVRDDQALQKISGLAITDYPLPEQSAQFELIFETVESPDGSIRASFIYAADLFDSSLMARLGRHYVSILRALAENPEGAIGDINLLNQEEVLQLRNWGVAVPPASAAQFVHQLIEQQVERCPQLAAVISGHIELSYAELNRRANRLAHRLISLGVKPEIKVGIAVERSIEMIMGLLAILKAGGAYVPLDPGYPGERLSYMLEDSGIQLLLTQTHIRSRIPQREGLTILEFDALDLSTGIETNPVVRLHGDHLAYVIYTSGSTGRPKGVSVAHGPLAMHLTAIKKVYDVRPGDRELMFFSMNFDAAVEQWTTPLIEGAAIVLSSANDLAGEGFVDLIEKHQVTTLHLPPAYLRMLLPLLDNKALSVRLCIAGGEAWYATDVAATQATFQNVRLVNAYGPTETVITPAAWISHASEEHALTSVDGDYAPIGQPVGARSLYVLDTELNLVPLGTTGELYVGGEGLARGYLDRPALTSERFIPDPFAQRGGRLYRTGDLVRWRSDGQLEYLGRVDHQIKIRGFRVELGEIESQLLAQAGVREAVVVAQEGRNGLRLIAYVAAHAGMLLNASLLKTALGAVLPDYMIPSLFIFLDTLPLNPNGKIDRQALPSPEQFDQPDYEPPVNAIEVMVSEIWAETLGVPRVGLYNNFFDLGGHSLLLIKIQHRLQERLNTPISIVDLFKYPTVASLVKFLSQGSTAHVSLQRHQQRAQRQRGAFIQRTQKAERIH